MEEIIKISLYYFSLICGSLITISLMIVVTVRIICLALDHLKICDVLKECLIIYVKQKRPNVEVSKEDICLTKSRINIKKEDK